MNYEKKYKEALERAKNEYQAYKSFNSFRGMLVRIFPELCESEDEKVRKEIIKFLELPHRQFVGERCQEEWIAWLEKQGKETNWKPTEEQYKALDYAFYSIPDNKRGNYYAGVLENLIEDLHRLEKQDDEKPVIEMKSAEESLGISSEKYNDIVNECLYGESNSSDKLEPKFQSGQWIVWQNKCYKVNYNGCGYELIDQNGLSTSLEYGTVDKSASIFTIQDAKDGDVLATPNYIYIFNSIDKETETVAFYCLIKKSDKHFSFGDYRIHDEILNSIPATKKQYDILIKAMTDAGYTFNFEKKELKKIKQKSQRIVSAEAKEALYDKPTDEEMKELLRTEYEKGRADAIAEMKSSWSEEDEKMLQGIINEIQANKSSGPSYDIPVYEEFLNWLKSLKQRVGS